jgi:hypothetical protein
LEGWGGTKQFGGLGRDETTWRVGEGRNNLEGWRGKKQLGGLEREETTWRVGEEREETNSIL